MRLRIVAFELLDIADGGATECINGLIRVTHHAQLRRVRPQFSPTDQRRHQSVLCMVGVLVLIDQHVLEATTVEVHHLGMLIEDADDLTNQIIKVHRISRAQAPLVLVEYASHRNVERILGLLRLSQGIVRETSSFL